MKTWCIQKTVPPVELLDDVIDQAIYNFDVNPRVGLWHIVSEAHGPYGLIVQIDVSIQ